MTSTTACVMFSIFIVQIMIYPHISKETWRENTKITVQPVKTNHTWTGSVMDGHRSYFHGGFSTSSFWGRCLGVGLKRTQNSRKKQHEHPPEKKNKGISKNSTNRCWNRNLKCWNGPSKKTCKKKLPLEGLKLVFCFFFLWDRGRCVSIHAPRLPRPGTCMFPMRQRKEWPHLRVENLRKSIKQAKDRASNQPNFVGYIW